MYLETICVNCTQQEWENLMKGAKPYPYKKLVEKIRKNISWLYRDLRIDLYNPWENDCAETDTHYILVHSAIEYFIRK